jgi:hypothetical protein
MCHTLAGSRRYHDHWAPGVVQQRLADRPEQQPGEPAKSAGANGHHIRLARLLHQRTARMTREDPLLNGKVGIRRSQINKSFVKQ